MVVSQGYFARARVRVRQCGKVGIGIGVRQRQRKSGWFGGREGGMQGPLLHSGIGSSIFVDVRFLKLNIDSEINIGLQ